MQNTNVPINWKIKKLKQVLLLLKDGTHGTHKDCDQGKFLLSAKDVVDGKVLCSEESRIISDEDFNSIHAKYKLQNKDIVLTIVGTVGRSAIINNYNQEYTFQRSVAILRPNESILSEFLYDQIQSNSFQNELKKRQSVSAQPGVYLEDLGSVPCVVPPIGEQKKIAEILGTWDRAIEELTDLIAEKKELKRGLMQRLLTGTQRLPGFTKPWNQKKILEFVHVGKIIIEKGKTLTAEQLNTGDIPVIAGGKTVPYYHDKYTHDIPCVTVSASGAYAGYVWWHNGKIWASDCNVLYGVNFDTRFLGLCLENMQKQIYRMQTGGAQPHVYADSIKTLKIPDVDLAEQKAIADVLSKADSEIDLLNQRLDVLKEQKRGLMQKLLTGEIRVKVDNE